MRKKLVVLVAIVAMTLVPAIPALATDTQAQQSQEVPDANCPEPEEYGFAGNRRFAQTFTAENSGELNRAWFKIIGVAAGTDFVVEIRTVDGTGTPTDAVLASAEIDDVPASTGNYMPMTTNFDPGAPVEEGKQYALSITVGAGQTFSIAGRENNPCPDGQMFVDSQATGEFVTYNTQDLVFATFVLDRPPTVKTTTPAKKTGVSRTNPRITATFSEVVKKDTVEATDPSTDKPLNVKLLDIGSGKQTAATVSCDADPCKTVTITPKKSLRSLTKYKVLISSEVEDLADNQLDQNPTKEGNQPKTWTFITKT